jgi:hypothetical protein
MCNSSILRFAHRLAKLLVNQHKMQWRGTRKAVCKCTEITTIQRQKARMFFSEEKNQKTFDF